MAIVIAIHRQVLEFFANWLANVLVKILANNTVLLAMINRGFCLDFSRGLRTKNLTLQWVSG
jgi:hypothetical protein